MPRRRPAEEGLLFDLPLDRTPDEPPAENMVENVVDNLVEQPALPLAEEPLPDVGERATLDNRHDELSPVEASPASDRGATGRPAAVTLRLRLTAGLVDLGVCGAVLVLLLVILLAQGIRPVVSDWPAGALFLLAFSFLYAVLPLAFWGRTPGMALAGLRTSSTDGRPLTFRQAVLKWLGSVLTVALAGLPLLLALGGRSLSDLISGSTTRLPEHRG